MAKIVEVTNPVTGQPTQVDQLDHTAQQIDDAVGRALPGGYYDKWVSQLPGQSLVDNGVFLAGCLVDQRQGRVVIPNTTYYSDNKLTTAAGTTSVYVTAYRYSTGTASGVNYASFKLEGTDTAPTYYAAPENVVRGYNGAGYGIDRWRLNNDNGSFVLESDGLLFTATGATQLSEWLECDYAVLAGKTVTISMVINGVLYSATGTVAKNVPTAYTTIVRKDVSSKLFFALSYSHSSSKFEFRANFTADGSAKYGAAKLELGTQQTLAHKDANGNWQLNELPNYADTLARCQRYKFAIESNATRPIFNGFMATTNRAQVSVQHPVQMRSAPSISVESKPILTIRTSSGETASGVTANSVTAYDDGNHQSMLLDFNGLSASFTANSICAVSMTGGKLIVTADL